SLDSADLVYVSAPDTTTGIDFQLETGGAITGTITDEYGNPIYGIDLDIYDANNNSVSSNDETDSLGNYTLNGLRTGYYKVRADPSSSDPYFDEYYNNRASLDSADLVYVSSPDTTTGIDFILNTGGCISGTITDESGNPIEGIDMDIYDENDNWVSSNDYSDSLGYYCLTNLRTGYYKVLADAGMGSGYVFEYYNDKTSMSDADLVYVSEPDTTADIDFILEEGNKITGTVYDESNEPIPNFIIYTFDAASGEVITAVLTDSLGQYVLQTLPTVYLKIMAMPVTWSSTPDTIHAFEWYGDAGTFENADSLNLNTSDSLGGIDFYIENAGRIAGTVYKNQTNNIIQGADVFGWYYLNDYYGWVDFFIDTTDSMGNYTLYNQRTGNYRVSAYNDSFEYQWYELAADTNDLDLVSVTMPNTTTGIDFYLNSFYPDITVSPDSISVNLITDAVYNKSIKISNIGGDTLEFTVGDDASWLGVSPTSGIVGSQEYSSIAVEFNTAGLTTGNYSATITVFSNDADESTIDIPVNLTVVEAIYVYPGDTDNDGKVSASDILPIGRFWHYSGAPRDSISTQWQAKRATPWSPEQGATYTDCDGDGSVDIDDVLAIGTNWRKTHTKKAGEYVFKLSGENTHRYIDNYKDIYTSLKGNGEAVREMKTLLQGIINGSPAEYFMKNNMLENTADKSVIRFGLPKQTDVTLKVYNITGSRIATLVNETLDAGYYSRTLNTSDLGPGVYLYRMEADGFVETKKIILVK
ncbi:MAG: carboxypeptidase regulatory-like domain-containing protein, partial [candidate division WOR-3 bacterium]|nr:carboxypeptidase regulatory-like domain-containing protein [candidate division WOR-3 bacterium]